MNNNLKRVFIASILALTPGLAFASQEHGPSLLTFWGSFLIYLGVLFFLLRKPAINGWAKRRASIAGAIQSNESILLKAEKRLSEAKKIQSSILNEVEQIKFDIAKESEIEAQTMLHEAREQAERITRQSHESVTLERRSGIAKAKKKVIEQIFADAQKTIKGNLTQNHDQQLRSSAVKTFSQVYH